MVSNISSLSEPLIFHCREKVGNRYQQWSGYIKLIHNYGSHFEIHIQSRSGFIFMIGKYQYGAFISIPAFGVGCELASYSDYFWNYECLTKLMNQIDAITVAEALRYLNRNNLI
jgi:hypothetical protein